MRAVGFALALVGGALLFSGTVFAGPATNKETVHLDETVLIEGQKLAPGDYKFEWGEPGPNVQVTIRQGKTAIASVPARVLSLNARQIATSYSTLTGQDGSKGLREVSFAGTKSGLEIGASSAAVGSQSAASGRPN